MPRQLKMKLIDLYKLPAAHRRTVESTDSVWDNEVASYSFEKIVLENCMVQVIEKEDLQVLPQGLSIDNTFTIFTDTPIYQLIEGTTFLGTSVYVPSSYFNFNDSTPAELQLGGWYNVITPHHRRNGLLEHTEAVLVKDTTLIDSEGLTAYPDTSDIEPIVKTKGGWKGDTWVNVWLNG